MRVVGVYPIQKTRREVEKESKSIGLEKEDVLNRARLRMGVGDIDVRVGSNPATSVYRDKPESKLNDDVYLHVCVYVCMFVCMFVCMYVCVCVCVYVYVYMFRIYVFVILG